MFDSGKKINTINLTFTQKLGLKIRKTSIKAPKIDHSALEIFKLIIADFQVENKAGRLRNFQYTVQVANTKFKVVLGVLFLKFSNTNVSFSQKTLTWPTKLYLQTNGPKL